MSRNIITEDVKEGFSFTKADNLTLIANIQCGKGFKFLIPEQYGGGFIKDYYRQYSKLGKNSRAPEPMYDMYEILGQWNRHNLPNDVFKCDPNTNLNKLKPIDEYTEENRNIGIRLLATLCLMEFPLKLVSPSCGLTYEEVEGVSISLPHPLHGFYPMERYSVDFHTIVATYASKCRAAGYKEFADKLVKYYEVDGLELTKYWEGTI